MMARQRSIFGEPQDLVAPYFTHAQPDRMFSNSGLGVVLTAVDTRQSWSLLTSVHTPEGLY